MPISRPAAAILSFLALVAHAPAAASCELTQAAYHRVELGMSLDEVVDIVGCPSQDLTAEKFPGRNARYIEWAGDDIEFEHMWVTIWVGAVGGKGLGVFVD